MRLQKFYNNYFFFLIALTGFLAFSCASSTAVPTREIDRSYTLPDGTKSWTGVAAVGFARDQERSPVSHTAFGGNPLLLEHSLSNEWTLEANPIPSAIRHQILNNETQRLGARIGSPLGYSSFRGFIFFPFFELDYLYRASSGLGWQVTANTAKTFSTDRTVFDGHGYGFRAGPLFQLDDTKAISLRIGAEYSKRQRIRNYNLINMNTVIDSSYRADSNVVFPLQFLLNWSLGKSWGTNFLYSFENFTHHRNYKGHFFFLNIHYFWSRKLGG
jgi:hypothetical protein